MLRPRGRSRYHLALLAELGRLRPLPYEIIVDGEREAIQATLVAVGQRPVVRRRDADRARCGHHGRVAGRHRDRPARPSAGCCACSRRSTPARSSGTTWSGRCAAGSIDLVTPGGVAYVDGERLGPVPVRVEAMPGALRVLAPPLAVDRPRRVDGRCPPDGVRARHVRAALRLHARPVPGRELPGGRGRRGRARGRPDRRGQDGRGRVRRAARRRHAAASASTRRRSRHSRTRSTPTWWRGTAPSAWACSPATTRSTAMHRSW